jgi:hypothetical protein
LGFGGGGGGAATTEAGAPGFTGSGGGGATSSGASSIDISMLCQDISSEGQFNLGTSTIALSLRVFDLSSAFEAY